MSQINRTEHGEQVAIIDFARAQAFLYPCLEWLFAIPNGARLPYRTNAKGQRYSPEAQKLKAEGLTPGIADLFLPFSAQGFKGYFIEMKRPGKIADIRPGQLEFLAYCESVGYLAQVFDNADDAIESLKWYLGIE